MVGAILDAVGKTIEYTGYLTMLTGAAVESSGPPLMFAGLTTGSTGVGAPEGATLFGLGWAAEASGPVIIASGGFMAASGRAIQMMSQNNGDCSQIDPMGGLTEKQAYEAISNPRIPNRLPKRYHLNNNVMPGKGKFLTQSRDEARQILREGLANLDEIGFWPNPQMEKTFRAVTKHASEIGTRGQKKIRAIIDYVNKEVKNFFPTKNQ